MQRPSWSVLKDEQNQRLSQVVQSFELYQASKIKYELLSTRTIRNMSIAPNKPRFRICEQILPRRGDVGPILEESPCKSGSLLPGGRGGGRLIILTPICLELENFQKAGRVNTFRPIFFNFCKIPYHTTGPSCGWLVMQKLVKLLKRLTFCIKAIDLLLTQCSSAVHFNFRKNADLSSVVHESFQVLWKLQWSTWLQGNVHLFWLVDSFLVFCLLILFFFWQDPFRRHECMKVGVGCQNARDVRITFCDETLLVLTAKARLWQLLRVPSNFCKLFLCQFTRGRRFCGLYHIDATSFC